MLQNQVVVTAPTHELAEEGARHLGKAMNGQFTGDLLVNDRRATFLRKHRQKVERQAAFVVKPFGSCTFDRQTVDAVIAKHHLGVAFIGNNKPSSLNVLENVPFENRRDILTFRFEACPADEKSMQEAGGVLEVLSDRIRWVMQERLRFNYDGDLWAVIRNVSREHPRDFCISLLLRTNLFDDCWLEVMDAMWIGAQANLSFSFRGLYRENGVLCYPAMININPA